MAVWQYITRDAAWLLYTSTTRGSSAKGKKYGPGHAQHQVPQASFIHHRPQEKPAVKASPRVTSQAMTTPGEDLLQYILVGGDKFTEHLG